MTLLYLIRHAEAEGNIFRRMHGQYNSRLTAAGLRQAAALKKRFETVPVDAVYASDLCRACQTAEAIAVPKQLPLRRDPRLREVNVGRWENRCFGELERREPEQLRRFLREPELWQVDGAEPYETYSGRFADALEQIARENDGKTAAVLSHGCVISGGLHRLLGLSHNASTCDNTGVSLLRYENGRFTPDYLYDNSHLTEELSTRARQRWWRERGGAFNLWFRDPGPGDTDLFDPDHLPPPGHSLRIAMLGDTPAGYAAWQDDTLSVLFLKPEFRHRRMGDQLFGEVVSALRGKRFPAVTVGFPTVNQEALCFFAHLGAAIVQMDDIYTVCRMDLTVPYPLLTVPGAE